MYPTNPLNPWLLTIINIRWPAYVPLNPRLLTIINIRWPAHVPH